jgi:hypothetical protein
MKSLAQQPDPGILSLGGHIVFLRSMLSCCRQAILLHLQSLILGVVLFATNHPSGSGTVERTGRLRLLKFRERPSICKVRQKWIQAHSKHNFYLVKVVDWETICEEAMEENRDGLLPKKLSG